MTKYILGCIAIPTLVACVASFSVALAETSPFSPFDTDGDGRISTAEAAAGLDDLENRIDIQARELREILASVELLPENLRQLDELDAGLKASRNRRCDPTLRFVLREQVQGQALAICATPGKSFTFGYTKDNEADSKQFAVNGGAGVILTPQPIPLSSWAQMSLLAFIEARNLTFKSGGSEESENEGQIRAGIQAEFDVPLGILQRGGGLDLVLSPYYLTDADLDAEGRGVLLTLQPRVNDWRLNAKRAGFRTYWEAAVTADYLDLKKAGNTGLTDDTEYMWLEGKLGAFYKMSADSKRDVFPNGFLAGFVGTMARNLNDEDTLAQFTASWEIYLDSNEKTAFKLQYARGDSREQPTFQDKFTVELGVRF